MWLNTFGRSYAVMSYVAVAEPSAFGVTSWRSYVTVRANVAFQPTAVCVDEIGPCSRHGNRARSPVADQPCWARPAVEAAMRSAETVCLYESGSVPVAE